MMAVRRQVLRAEVEELVLQRLLESRWAPGSRLSIDGLARDLEVSPRPAREAMVSLKRSGLVEHVALRGYVVAPPLDAEHMTELLDARKVVESAALDGPSRTRAAWSRTSRRPSRPTPRCSPVSTRPMPGTTRCSASTSRRTGGSTGPTSPTLEIGTCARWGRTSAPTPTGCARPGPVVREPRRCSGRWCSCS